MKNYLIESIYSQNGKLDKKVLKEGRLAEFQAWLDKEFYPGFDPSDLSDEEYYELEDMWQAELENSLDENDVAPETNLTEAIDATYLWELKPHTKLKASKDIAYDAVDAIYEDTEAAKADGWKIARKYGEPWLIIPAETVIELINPHGPAGGWPEVNIFGSNWDFCADETLKKLGLKILDDPIMHESVIDGKGVEDK